MGTKNNPGKFDCYENAEDDEPMFVLLARDPLATALVRLWGSLRATLAKSQHDLDKAEEAYACATAMEQWKANHPDH